MKARIKNLKEKINHMSNMSNIGQNIPIFVFLTNMVICWLYQIFPMKDFMRRKIIYMKARIKNLKERKN